MLHFYSNISHHPQFPVDPGRSRVNNTTGVRGTHPNEECRKKKPNFWGFFVKLKEWGKECLWEKSLEKLKHLFGE